MEEETTHSDASSPSPSVASSLNLSTSTACLLCILISVSFACLAEYIKYRYVYSTEDYKVSMYSILFYLLEISSILLTYLTI